MSMRTASALALCLLLGCQRSSAPTEPLTDWKPFQLGSHHRPVSTQSAAAQQAFDQGLIWAFAFNHDEAQRAFHAALKHDPSLAIAWWGIALVNGPHINNPSVDEARAKRAWEALEQARALSSKANPIERELIDALGHRYAWPQPSDRAPLDAAYAEAMGKLAARYPDDADIATLHAEALMDTRPWDQWTRDGQPQPGTLDVLSALERAQKLAPEHPGASHLWVHAIEASPHPERARAAADRLRGLVPDASHLQHMPSHIDVRLGLWEQAAQSNLDAIAADDRYLAGKPELDFYAFYIAHNRHFLAYTATMQGNSKVAISRAREVVAGLPPERVRTAAQFLDAFTVVELDALKRFGRWDEILDYPIPLSEFPVSTAFSHFTRSVAYAAKNELQQAKREQAQFEASLSKIPADYYWGNNVAASVLKVAQPYVAGEIAYRERRLDDAVRELEQAVRLEDELKYDEPPPWTTPTRHALGAVLLAAGRAAEAEAVYLADLARYPENGWSLTGLAQALAQQHKPEEAKIAAARAASAFAKADTPVESSCLCVEKGR
jgi:tetratricopeptide (TPR) repeat protein